MTDTSELIRRLEEATEGSRFLDGQIASYLGIFPDMGYETWEAVERDAPHYTTSIDAALTLVPEGLDGKDTCVLFERYANGKGNCGILPWWKRSRDDEVWSKEQATLPLALCIAALKARARVPEMEE